MKAKILLIMRSGNAKVVAEFLSKEGYEPMIAKSFEEIRTLIESRGIDLAIVDVSDVSAMIWELLEAMRKAQIPFVVVNKPNARLAIPAVSLQKPISKAELLRVIEALL